MELARFGFACYRYVPLQPAPVGCMSSAAVDAVGVTFKAVTGSGCRARARESRISPWKHLRPCAVPGGARQVGSGTRRSQLPSTIVRPLHLGRSGLSVGGPAGGLSCCEQVEEGNCRDHDHAPAFTAPPHHSGRGGNRDARHLPGTAGRSARGGRGTRKLPTSSTPSPSWPGARW